MLEPRTAPKPRLMASDDLFAWRGGDVILFGERTGDGWIVARGWPQADCLTDVRRWTFPEPGAFVGQIRRLAREATGQAAHADAAASAAAAWATRRAAPKG